MNVGGSSLQHSTTHELNRIMADTTTVNDISATERYRQRPETVVTDQGEGPPVVFVHGMLTDQTLFKPQLAALSGTYRTIAYDLRARTASMRAPTTCTILLTISLHSSMDSTSNRLSSWGFRWGDSWHCVLWSAIQSMSKDSS